jgi:hypothetical protein
MSIYHLRTVGGTRQKDKWQEHWEGWERMPFCEGFDRSQTMGALEGEGTAGLPDFGKNYRRRRRECYLRRDTLFQVMTDLLNRQ